MRNEWIGRERRVRAVPRGVAHVAIGAVVGLFMVLASLTASPAYAAGSCISVELSAPVALPGGDVSSEGRVTLCEARSFTPVSSFHQVAIDGRPVGLIRSRVARTAGGDRDAAASMTFMRRNDGTMVLIGFAHTDGSRLEHYEIDPVPRVSVIESMRASKKGDSGEVGRELAEERIVTIAAFR